MKALAIANAAARRLLRDRTALFFLIVLPVLLIVIVGAVARSFSSFPVGVVDLDGSVASHRLVSDLTRTSGLTVTSYPDVTSVRRAVARAEVEVGVVVPHGFGASWERGASSVSLLAEHANSAQQAAAARVASVVANFGARTQAARFAAPYGEGFLASFALADALFREMATIRVVRDVVPVRQTTLPAGYEYSAPTELVLFVFLSAVAGGATIVETRRLGMFERMSAAPVRPSAIIAGESLTYVAVALCQSALIVAVGSLAFGVSWGDPVAATVLVVLWSLVGAAAGMVAGTYFRTPEQASAIGPIIGITLAMLGGCMWPLAIVAPGMRAIGHLTPHAWAIDAWTELIANHGDLVSIGRELGVLALFVIGLFIVATLRLRRTIGERGA